MSELINRANGYEKIKRRFGQFLGRSALKNTPIVDERLILKFRETPIDSVNNQVIESDWRPISHSMLLPAPVAEQLLAEQQGWSIDDSEPANADGEIRIMRQEPEAVIVDEYGFETVYEPTKSQLDELAEAYNEISDISAFAGLYSYELASEGQEAIETPLYSDEKAIAKLFAKDLKDIKSLSADPAHQRRKELNYRMSNVLFNEYVADNQPVTILKQTTSSPTEKILIDQGEKDD